MPSLTLLRAVDGCDDQSHPANLSKSLQNIQERKALLGTAAWHVFGLKSYTSRGIATESTFPLDAVASSGPILSHQVGQKHRCRGYPQTPTHPHALQKSQPSLRITV